MQFISHLKVVNFKPGKILNTNFWIGNGLLALALIILVFMGTLSQMFGIGAVIAWMVLAAAGTYFIMKS